MQTKMYLINLVSPSGKRYATLRLECPTKVAAIELGNKAIDALTPLIEDHYDGLFPGQPRLKLSVKVTPFEDTGTK